MNKLIVEALSLDYHKTFGFQEYLFNLLKFFKEHRNDIHVDSVIIVCKEIDRHAFVQFEPELNVVGLEIRGTLHKYLVLNTLYKRLNLSKNDIILYTNNYGALIKQCKYLLVIHDLLYLRKKYMPNFMFRLQRSLFVPRSARIADKVIGISQWVRKDIIYQFGVNQEKVSSIYNYFNFDKFEGVPDEAIVNQFKGKKYFLVVCAGAYHKNTITTLKSFTKYVLEGGEYGLITIGTYTNEIQSYISNSSQQVRNMIYNLHGISNASLGFLYKHAIGYISATMFEGLGMPIVEALYFDVPCLLSDIEVVKEVSCGKAIYFHPTDVDALANHMHNIDKIKSCATKSYMIEMFSSKETVGKYIDLINSFC